MTGDRRSVGRAPRTSPRRAPKGALCAARLAVALLGALAAISGAPAIAASTPTSAESSNPINDQGSNYNFRSNITAITPGAAGLSVQVLEFADRLQLSNHTGQTVTIYGYEGEPYARVLADGTAEQNVRSPSTYLNTNFYGAVTIPPSANPNASPKWEVVDRTGQFEWHDHRIHWMSPLLPPAVKDKSKRTLIFDWQVPIAVGARRGAIEGQLFWEPESSSAPVAAIVLGAAIVLAGILLVVFVRRRRSREALRGGDRGGPAAGAGLSGGAAKESW